MGTEALKQALVDCKIDFDRRVLVTNLLQEYRMPYKEINEILADYITFQEKKGKKFEKRFLITGDEDETNNEIYTVVKGESKMQEWLRKLKNSESALYSIEIAGGAKAAADIFKPMIWCPLKVDKIGVRAPLQLGAAVNGSSNGEAKPVKAEASKKSKGFDFGVKKTTSTENRATETEKDIKKSSPLKKQISDTKKPSPETKKSSTDTKKSSPVAKKSSPEEQKPSNAKPIGKKGIASFFGPQSSTAKLESKKSSGVVKPPTPKKMVDFFKKTEKTAPSTSKAAVEEEKAANVSFQLFSNEDEEVEVVKEDLKTVFDADTSDDEEQLEALRRKCMEKDQEEEISSASTNKRRRILDSEDEDDEPDVKHDKKENNEPELETEKIEIDDNDDDAGKSETFLDEDGFVITIKSKKTASAKKTTAKPKTPKKSPPVLEANKKSEKLEPKPTSKTKQGNIRSFFSKK